MHRHRNSPNCKIRSVLSNQFNWALAIECFGDDVVTEFLQHLHQVHADDGLILRNNHPGGHVAHGATLRTQRKMISARRTSRVFGATHNARHYCVAVAPVSQPVEEAVSNTVQCGFESHPGHVYFD